MSTQNSSAGSLGRGIKQLLDGALQDDTSAGSSYHEKGPRTISKDEDTERFCAYRKYHHGEGRIESLDLLYMMSVAQANGMPWYLDVEQPLGITRPGAEDEDVRYSIVCPVAQGPGSSAQATDNSSHVSQTLNTDIQGPGHLGAGSEQLNHEAVGLQPEPAAYELVDVNGGSQDASTTEVTVGWEIEFMVPTAQGDLTQDLLTDGRYLVPEEEQEDILDMTYGYPARKYIASLLREAGIPALHFDIHEAECDTSDLPGAEALDITSDPYAIWRVKTEYISIELDPDCVGLELSSRKLPANELGFAELDQVLRLTRNNVLVRVSEDCGLHVHVDASVLDLSEQRHFVCLYLTVESVLFSLCQPGRRVSEWCCQVYDSSRLALEAVHLIKKGGHGSDRGARLRLMHRAIHGLDSEQLRNRLMQWNAPDTRNALAMKMVGQGKHTFEFRHFQGSFDSALVQHWTRVCLALVMAAKGLGDRRQHPASQVYDVFYQVSCRPEEEAWKCLLRVLDLGDYIAFWELARSSYASSQDGVPYARSESDSESWGLASQYLPRVG